MAISLSKAPQRFITDSSKARVCYVASNCVAKMRKKYQARQKSMLFSKSQEGRNSYLYSKEVVHILSFLKEDEHFLKEHTLIVNRFRQKTTTKQWTYNVTDQLYTFFNIDQ